MKYFRVLFVCCFLTETESSIAQVAVNSCSSCSCPEYWDDRYMSPRQTWASLFSSVCAPLPLRFTQNCPVVP